MTGPPHRPPAPARGSRRAPVRLLRLPAKATAVEVVGRTGLDFVSIDVEHGGKVWETVENMVRAAELSGMHALVLTQDIPAAVAKAPPAQSGVVVYGADDSARWSPRGCRFFAYPSGVGLLFDAAPGLRQDMAAACAVPREIP